MRVFNDEYFFRISFRSRVLACCYCCCFGHSGHCCFYTDCIRALSASKNIATPNLSEEKSNAIRFRAGKYIGVLERLFILGFVIGNFWEGIGFLLAAKSIFRFGDLNNAKERHLTEYVLIGTLLSFGAAILIGLLFNLGLKWIQ